MTGRINVFLQGEVNVSVAALLAGKDSDKYSGASLLRGVQFEGSADEPTKVTTKMNVLESKLTEVLRRSHASSDFRLIPDHFFLTAVQFTDVWRGL